MEAALTLSAESSDKVIPLALKYNIIDIADSTMEKTVGFTLTYAVPACDCSHMVFVSDARKSDVTVAQGSTTKIFLRDPEYLGQESSQSPDF